MSKLRSSSPSRSSKAEYVATSHQVPESYLAARRPSWTPSIPESYAVDDLRPQSRHRSKHTDDGLPSSTQDWHGAVPSLLKARRPSFPPSIAESFQRARRPRVEPEESPEVSKPSASGLPESPQEGKSLHSSWEINVKDLVGDAVGNMSISPTSRDIVLAARRGLFIIDLEYPLRIPRFLPQGGTWDVADVQWNPHPSHAQYIVSTSSEKLLIWNLCLGGKTSIEHILKSHYRAITDINWHTSECDLVVSTGIDSWIWAWDLREPNKPIFGLSAFKAGGTQVKWNYQDGNLLASSHSNEVLIWDRRKGSLPVTHIRAHSSKIYGIDWSRSTRNEITTCSLDKSIKTWDINSSNIQGNTEPKAVIRTTYPVWRARNLPFGEGILSLPQRGETTLEMYAKGEPQNLVETFEGHSDVVKEFVWRKGTQDDFQLITWSKDRTLRFWPIDADAMQKVGHVPDIVRGRSKLTRSEMEMYDTFRNPPDVDNFSSRDDIPALSLPFGNRSILGEVRAAYPAKSTHPTFGSLLLPVDHDRHGSGHSATSPPTDTANATPTLTSTRAISFARLTGTGGTMSKGGAGTKSVAQVDQLTWLSSVKVASGSKRGSSSGGGSGSGAPSRLGSGSRPPSGHDRSVSEIGGRQRSGSLGRPAEERKENEGSPSLQDEITSVLTKLAASKIKLEKHDLTKKRTCTLGLHGPWGETSSVFMRVTFTFPRDYPQTSHPQGTPIVDLERNPLISMSDRAYILRHLRRIRERKRPCLEACLRFLLFADEGHNDHDLMDSESSSDEDLPSGKKSRDVTVSLLRNNKNLAEPRTSQGAFGPNGELICFFRAPRRKFRTVPRDFPGTGNKSMEDQPASVAQLQDQPQAQPQQQKTSYFQSPALVSDAVRRLGLAAMDRTVQPIDPRQPERGLNILRAMTNLLTIPQYKMRHDSDPKHPEEVRIIMRSLHQRSTIFLKSTRGFTGADQKVAEDYVFMADSLAEVCERNAGAARHHGRFDHERVFKTLRTLFTDPEVEHKKEGGSNFASDSLASQVIKRLYADIAKEKDVQMLAMIAMLVLQTDHGTVLPPSLSRKKETVVLPHMPLRIGGVDYFSLTKAMNPSSPVSPAWPRLPSPIHPPLAPSMSSSNSSRGSWSSLFNTGSMRQFMNGVQDSFKEGLTTPSDILTPSSDLHHALSRSAEKPARGQESPGSGARRKRTRKDSTIYSPAIISRSWNEGPGHPSKALSTSFSSSGPRQASLRFTDSTSFIQEKRSVVFEPPIHEEIAQPLFDMPLIEQFKLNVYAYAELLFKWQMFHKRLELLKAVSQRDVIPSVQTEVHRIGLHRVCTRADCRMLLPEKSNVCKHCGTSCSMPACTVCRLPVRGLSRTCLSCSHVTHISCWDSLEVTVPICPSGCGCFCTGSDGPFTRPSTRLGFTPPLSTLLLASDIS
ncbi:hypothetical protein GALMADRAFT_76692 [Galerina marginata CBS 339.88]|uniref:WDR59/RTC1-like RING zinc finger domain-containing protein n=1 Tax=Galerina marginata (strain CBS 339.88) TaxID=685588 RepID=A0A067SGM8_GALM3|nr:hypothetical protein GALMADRAFT_76692 [Galerina marginata CBS 339.88]